MLRNKICCNVMAIFMIYLAAFLFNVSILRNVYAETIEENSLHMPTGFTNESPYNNSLLVPVKAYTASAVSGISLETKPFNILDRAEMHTRYETSRRYYDDHQSYFDALESDYLINIAAALPGRWGLDTVTLYFGAKGWFGAVGALDRFLSGTGEAYPIDIELVINAGGVSKLVYGKILSSIDSGQDSGRIRIEQKDWGIGRGQDAKWTFGTLKLDWETDRTDVVMFVSDIYSFDIKDETAERRSIPLYKAAGDLVLSGSASFLLYRKNSKDQY